MNKLLHTIANSIVNTKSTLSYIADGILNGSRVDYVKQPDAPVTAPKPELDTERILASLRHMETRGEKDPYSFYQSSGNSDIGDALGAYQITEAKLKEQSKKLGYAHPITRDQFLQNPNMQDDFMRKMVDQRFKGEFNFDLPTMFAAHRGGFSDLNNMASVYNNYKQYADEGVQEYNSLAAK